MTVSNGTHTLSLSLETHWDQNPHHFFHIQMTHKQLIVISAHKQNETSSVFTSLLLFLFQHTWMQIAQILNLFRRWFKIQNKKLDKNVQFEQIFLIILARRFLKCIINLIVITYVNHLIVHFFLFPFFSSFICSCWWVCWPISQSYHRAWV